MTNDKVSSSLYHYSWDQHYDFSVTLVTRLFTMQQFFPTIDETSHLATAGLVKSTRLV